MNTMKVSNIAFADLSQEQKALVLSEDLMVRAEAAKQGLAMDKLIDDPEPYVRYQVARNEFGLDKLAHDEDWHIRELIHYRLDAMKTTLKDWCLDNFERLASRIAKPELAQDTEPRRKRFRDIESLAAFGKAKASEYNQALENSRTIGTLEPARAVR